MAGSDYPMDTKFLTLSDIELLDAFLTAVWKAFVFCKTSKKLIELTSETHALTR